MEESHIRLLLHCEVRWLSRCNCLDRFFELYDSVAEFLSDKDVMSVLIGDAAKAKIGYLSDIFQKLQKLNVDLQRANKTLLDAKTKIFGFIDKLQQWRRELARREFNRFARLGSCTVTEDVLNICTDHLDRLVNDFTNRFKDLEEMDFPGWLSQYSLVSLDNVDTELRDELAELQNNASATILKSIPK